jgi:hypothetical protein
VDLVFTPALPTDERFLPGITLPAGADPDRIELRAGLVA